MKVKQVTATKTETSSTLDLQIPTNLPKSEQNRIKNDIGEYLKEQILSDLQDTKSPVTGRDFKALSKGYQELKKADGAGGVPNLENSGDMLDALDFKITEEGIKIGVFGKNAPKADGHNNLSGASSLPRRQFLPEEGQSFRPEIKQGIESIIAEVITEEMKVPKAELREIETKAEFIELLRSTFTGLSLPEIKKAIALDDEWLDELEDLGLTRWL